MKKVTLLMLAITCFLINANAQLRQLRPDEIKFYSNLYSVLYGSMPHDFRDWTAVDNGPNFDVLKYFCPDVAGPECMGKCGVNLGTKDPYQLGYSIDYSMPGDQSDAIKVASMSLITDYNNTQQIAGMLKASAKTKLLIYVSVNVYTPGSGVFTVVNCPKVPVQTLSIPVPTTLAVLGQRSAQCPYMKDGRVDMSPSGDGYYDNALVFMGKPVAYKQNQSYSDGYTHTSYGVGFDKTKIGILVVQNLMVTFRGDADDIKEAIKLIDWQKLSALLTK